MTSFLNITMKGNLVFLFLFLTSGLFAQNELNKYWVQFTDKNGTPYSIFRPQEFLSPRSIERRQRQGIAIEENDLPISPTYVLTLEAMGAKVYTKSKWFNAVTVLVEEAETIEKIGSLPFVKKIEPTGKYRKPRPVKKNKRRDFLTKYPKTDNYYGYGWNQISMLNGNRLHEVGYRGAGMMVAVLDGGFTNVDIMPFFDSLRTDYRMLKSRDLVDNDDWAYEASSHGSQVASTIASNLPGLLVGTAPDVTLICIRTEEVGSELRIEEDNWIAGAEFADSLGVDVINSSLGYTAFDKKEMNYTYQNIDGNTARVSQGADIAASKGILVVNSAGNEGDGAWRYVGVPADADSVMAVGGVNRKGGKATFSSYGPTRDGRIKPSVVARGYQTIVGSLYEYAVDSANGTSFASPIMAGMVASLWQAFPYCNNMEIMAAVENSGSRAANPDNNLGYGIPDMMKAYFSLSGETSVQLDNPSHKPVLIPNPFIEKFDLILWGIRNGIAEIRVTNPLGQVVYQTKKTIKKGALNRISFEKINHWKAGCYVVSVEIEELSYYLNLLKM